MDLSLGTQKNNLVGAAHLVVLIDDELSQAERKMTETQAGEALIQKYAQEWLSKCLFDVRNKIQ